ncbi:nitroreductase family protein [Mycobacterium sp. 21AC1]|uniref:Acg family FMN-binding oxidoreductase n=1 Tax=[Mycobacterium] appelbergii TaxID=2939269 RepID=UPI0029392151|nr:nitroreductase family protein [Mycobacterium sp. 21AC1]MDV3124218.1 nitroreductase family protein [Mycobacterium sp. 21AC1]
MSSRFPDAETLRAALSLAVRAPSVHNSQPWRWVVRGHSLHLYADPERHLPATDPDCRDLQLSCGATLHHCVVALASLDWKATVHRLPDPGDPNHLAAITMTPHPSADVEVKLATAIQDRRTDRRHYSAREVSPADIALIGARVARSGVAMRRVESLTDLNAVIDQAVSRHVSDYEYLSELTRWSGRYASLAGIPAHSTPAPDPSAPVPGRLFAGPVLMQPTNSSGAGDHGVVLALGTRDDDALARLRAGEATSLLLLTATALGMATCPITEPLEVAETRAALRDELFDSREYPQMLVRVGWPAADADLLPATPRRKPRV